LEGLIVGHRHPERRGISDSRRYRVTIIYAYKLEVSSEDIETGCFSALIAVKRTFLTRRCQSDRPLIEIIFLTLYAQFMGRMAEVLSKDRLLRVS
jgi:hypothetical protein